MFKAQLCGTTTKKLALLSYPFLKKSMPNLTLDGNCILGGTKLVWNELFPFLDLQDCLVLLCSADNSPVDHSTRKNLLKQVLFYHEFFPSGISVKECIFSNFENGLGLLIRLLCSSWVHSSGGNSCMDKSVCM